MVRFILSNRKPFITSLIQIFIIINIVIIITIISQVEVLADTIYVPDNYSTIQAAVNAASSGDTIIVGDGTYTENVNVNKDHLTIKSENGADSTIVQAANSNDHVFEVAVDYVEISGFTVKEATGSSQCGIMLNAKHCNIVGNNLSNNFCGILLLGSNHTIMNNSIMDNSWSIQLTYTSNNDITNNNIANNDVGMILYYSNTNNITNNRISNNWDGIGLQYSENNKITNNKVLSNNQNGIYLSTSNKNTIKNNAISNNLKDGIYLFYSLENSIYLNNIVSSGNVNVHSYKSTNSWFSPEQITYTFNGKTYTNYLGNYLDDYIGEDADNDGIGDTPYVISYTGEEQVNYPLMIPFENYALTENNPPTIEITSGPSGTIDYNDVTFTWNGNDPDGEVTGYYYELDDPTPENWTAETNHTFNSVSEGNHTFYVQAKDNMGATSSVISRSFTYTPTENNPPTIEITSPSNGETVSGTVRFSSYATDDCGLDKVEFYIDDELKVSHGPFGPDTVGSTCNWDCDTTPGSIDYIPNGNHTFKAKAYDTAGQTCVDNISFIVDNIVENQPPVADAGMNQTVHSGQVAWFDGCNSSDPDGTIISYGWDFGDGATATGCAVSHRFRGAMNESKTYAVTLTVEDNSGTTATDSCDITVMPLEKTVKVTHQPSIPIPGVTVFAKMEVSYNWVDEISGEDVYIVSRVDCSSNGFAGIYAFNFIDKHSRANPWTTPTIHPLLWWNLLLCRGPSEKTYGKDDFKDFEFFKERAYGKDFFEGIEVYAYDIMYITAYGYAGIQVEYLIPFLERNSTYFRPESTEVPTVPIDINDLNLAHLCSPGEMRVYDPEGRVTGLVNGEIKEEIPYSAYNDNTVIILSPVDSYRYEVVGTDEGSYGLGVDSVEDGESTMFTAADIPTTSRAVHQYTIDWDALSRGEEGVTVQVDSDGDGKFEDTFTSDDELTQDEFLEGTSPPPAAILGDFGSANSGPPDCIVDFEDLMIFALAYGSTSSDSNWNPVCDIASEGGVLEADGVIDFEDLMIFAMNYGKTCADL